MDERITTYDYLITCCLPEFGRTQYNTTFECSVINGALRMTKYGDLTFFLPNNGSTPGEIRRFNSEFAVPVSCSIFTIEDGQSFDYLPPTERIDFLWKRLTDLIDTMRSQITPDMIITNQEELLRNLCVMTAYFRIMEFLIHPYFDGNKFTKNLWTEMIFRSYGIKINLPYLQETTSLTYDNPLITTEMNAVVDLMAEYEIPFYDRENNIFYDLRKLSDDDNRPMKERIVNISMEEYNRLIINMIKDLLSYHKESFFTPRLTQHVLYVAGVLKQYIQ